MKNKLIYTIVIVLGLILVCQGTCAFAQDIVIPKLNFISRAETTDDLTLTLQIFILFTVLSFAPALFLLTTSFARVVIVLSFLKKAAGLQDLPGQLVAGLALFVTIMIMMPVWKDINENALQPYLKKEIAQAEGFKRAAIPVRTFMLKQTREKDIALFVYFSKIDKPETPDDVPFHILAPAFIISEMKTAFIYGFLIYIPFLIVDLVVASILLAMGMMVLPPVTISAPFKIILFILVDGWYLVLRSLVGSFN